MKSHSFKKIALRGWLAAIAVLPSLLLPAYATAAEAAPDRPLEKVVIAYSSISGNMAPLWITHERGFFRKHGLDVQLVFIESGSTTVQSLISKEVSFAQMAGAGVIQSRLRGSDVVMIAGVINTLTFKFYVDKNIKQPDQLKGKTLAVTRHGSSTDFALRYALERYGLSPDKDVTILQAGNMAAIAASLESGKVHGAMLSAPFTLKAKNLGFPMMADLQMLGLEYQHTGLATTQALIKSRPDLVHRAMRAYVEGIHYYKTHRAESLAVLAKYLKSDDAETLADVYEDVGLNLTAAKPYPTLRGIGIMLRELVPANPKAAAARPEDFVDLTFIKELDKSEFIDRLYKKPAVALAGRGDSATAASDKEMEARQGDKRKQTARPATSTGSSATADSAREYTVEPGDTLHNIARKYYGTHRKWERIFQANQPVMKNPDYIYVGQRIIIPS
ncbi:MAG TPA: ABC transporter substrate-binding protein [Candidatus Binatia bacterium]|nr:ABC transporter substrate-binding protein [Candidatus Binatia bacterium]